MDHQIAQSGTSKLKHQGSANLKNKKTVIVRVNDRGPFVKDRIIDLSYAAANRLEIIEKGSEFVKVELIDLENKVKIWNVTLDRNTCSRCLWSCVEKGF